MNKEDVVHTYNGILLSYEKNGVMPFAATRMDQRSYEVKSEKNQRLYDITYMGKLNMIQISMKLKQTHRHEKQMWLPLLGEGGGGRGWVGSLGLTDANNYI